MSSDSQGGSGFSWIHSCFYQKVSLCYDFFITENSSLYISSLQVVIVDIMEEVGENTAEELCSRYGNRVIFVKCDVTNKEDCEGIS